MTYLLFYDIIEKSEKFFLDTQCILIYIKGEIKMARVMLIRHAKKGNGTNAPKNHISPESAVDARNFGQNLPSIFAGGIDYVGGSLQCRSLDTALQIAKGAGSDPRVLESHQGLGNEEELIKIILNDALSIKKGKNEKFAGRDIKSAIKAYRRATANHNGIDIAGLRSILSKDNYEYLKYKVLHAVLESASKLDGNIILGSHSPNVQLFIEVLMDEEYNYNVPELGYLVVNVYKRRILLLDTNLKSVK